MNSNIDPQNIGLGRRKFLKQSAIGAGLMVVPSYVVGQSASMKSPNSRLNIALVGVAGRGRSHTIEAQAENVVALCDVDMGHVKNSRTGTDDDSVSFNEALTHHEKKGARWFKDYRVMFEEMGDKIDAVMVTTPDHMHYAIALSALNLGKHVYCEKPLVHTVEQARSLTAAAARSGVVTQMGNQGHSNEGTRFVKEWIQAGLIGEIREVHSWTDRPARFWQQGLPRPDHSNGAPPVPDGLDWKLWLGIAEDRPYDPAYAPFNWRAYLDFGCGALGDMACHIMDSAYWGLELGFPERIAADTTYVNGYTFPKVAHVKFNFPARPDMAPVEYHWYSGGMMPVLPSFLKDFDLFKSEPLMTNGTIIVGDGAAIVTDTYSKSVQIYPREKFMELRQKLPPKTLPRVPKADHFTNWTDAIRESGRACSDFSYAGPFTEMVNLGVIGIRVGRELRYDAKNGRFINDEEANKLLGRPIPDGWILG